MKRYFLSAAVGAMYLGRYSAPRHCIAYGAYLGSGGPMIYAGK